jgi:molybdate transport repressor ModE-like protein
VLDLRQLTVLRAVARTGSIAAAARTLELSQPTVTHHLAGLEAHVGARLVERTARGTTLTDLGQLFLDHAEVALDRLDLAVTEVAALAKHGVVTLRIGTFPTAGAWVLPRAVAAMQRQTGVRVELLEAEPPTLLARLESRQLHAALAYFAPDQPPVLSDELTAVTLFDDPFLVVLPETHPAAALDPVPLSVLAEDGWIMSHQADEPSDTALIGAAAAVGFIPRPVLRTDDYDVMFGFVAAGVGVALAPEMALVPREGVVVRALGAPLVSRSITFVTFRTGSPPAVAVLLEALRAERSLP